VKKTPDVERIVERMSENHHQNIENQSVIIDQNR
jgi:hypothetical protein